MPSLEIMMIIIRDNRIDVYYNIMARVATAAWVLIILSGPITNIAKIKYIVTTCCNITAVLVCTLPYYSVAVELQSQNRASSCSITILDPVSHVAPI